MTDFTDSIEATGEQIEDLQQDLETHLEDILDVDVQLESSGVHITDDGARLDVDISLPGLEEELDDRLQQIDSRFTAKYLDWYLDIELAGDPE